MASDPDAPAVTPLLHRGKLQWLIWCRDNPKGKMRDEAWDWFMTIYGNGIVNRSKPGRWMTDRERAVWEAGYEDGREVVKLSAQQLDFSF